MGNFIISFIKICFSAVDAISGDVLLKLFACQFRIVLPACLVSRKILFQLRFEVGVNL